MLRTGFAVDVAGFLTRCSLVFILDGVRLKYAIISFIPVTEIRLARKNAAKKSGPKNREGGILFIISP